MVWGCCADARSVPSQYSSLAGRGNDNYPRVELDRFRRSVLVRGLDRDTALIEDGRGTRLVVDQWKTTMGRAAVVRPCPGCDAGAVPAGLSAGSVHR